MNDAEPAARRPWVGVLAVLAAAALWSLSGCFIKLLNRHGGGLPAITIACYRSLIVGAVLTPLAWRQLRPLRAVPVGWPAASVIVFTVMTACFVIATTRTAAASVILLQYTAPLFVFALSPLLLGERPEGAEALALGCALVGVAVVFVGNPASDTPALVIATASGAGYGTLTIILRRLRAVSPVALMWMNSLGSGLLMLPMLAVAGEWRVPPEQMPLLVGASVLQFGLPYILFSIGLRHIEAHRASLLSLIEAVLNPIWTWLLAGERPPAAALEGGPLILAGVAGWILLVWRRERARGAPAAVLDPPPVE